MNLRRLTHCPRGKHDWVADPLGDAPTRHTVVGHCSRCGTEATAIDVARSQAEGGNIPNDLMTRPRKSDEDRVKDAYIDGRFDSGELNDMLKEVLKDE